MKFWLLTTEYPPFFGGGISTYCHHTAAMLSANGHQVSVFINDKTVNDIRVELQDAVRIIRFNPSRTGSAEALGYVTNISYEFAHIVKHFIAREGKPDIIESQEYMGIAYYLLQYKHMLYEWCRDVPILITMHSPSFLYMEYNHVSMYRYPNFWSCEMERFCLNAADYIIAPSRYMINELGKRFSLAHEKISVVPNPFAIPASNGTTVYKKPGEIVFYGKLTVQKGAFKLMSYFRELWDKGFSRPLYLLGGQDIVYHPENKTMGSIIKSKYQKYIEKGLLKLEQKIPPTRIEKRLAKAEVVIIPSNNDNLPYAVLETMALGKIVLTSKQGGQAELIEDGQDGFIFDHEDPITFSRQLTKILGMNETEQDEVGKRAIQKVAQHLNYDSIYSRKITIIEKIALQEKKDRKMFPFVQRQIKPIPELVDHEEIKGRLSVVIPYFNMGKYIHETINSILKSQYHDKEIIIINDGSTYDNSLEALNRYRDFPGIKVIDSPNRGVAHARNLGARQSQAEYLAFLDADDTVKPDYYTYAIKNLSYYDNVHFVGCWSQYFGESDKTWPAFVPEPPLILYHNLVNSSALVYKRRSFLAAGKNDGDMIFPGFEDYESVISLTAKGLKGIALPELLFNYRVRQDSMIRSVSKEKKLFLYQYISNKHKEVYTAYATDLFNLAEANGPGIALNNPTLDYHLADKIPFGSKASLQVIRLIKKNRYIRTIAYKIYSYTKK